MNKVVTKRYYSEARKEQFQLEQLTLILLHFCLMKHIMIEISAAKHISSNGIYHLLL
jgi:hypothetical protein